ncbi:hypothetical protein LJB90_00905 [Eubacteriales bacterium OttesenSCG-928-G02]|nr:hypothetical protein [Eubacteriales bacterium OttesenSCG-928-G02]
MITFDTADGSGSILYSSSGKAPKAIYPNGRTVSIKTLRINKNWFHYESDD